LNKNVTSEFVCLTWLSPEEITSNRYSVISNITNLKKMK